MPRTCLRLKTCTRAPGSRCQCTSKLELRKVSAEAVGRACETPTVMHDRGLLAVSRDRGAVFAQWLRKEAARRGYAWRQQRRAQQLCLLRAACVPPGDVVGEEALRLALPGAGVLVEVLLKLPTRGKSTSTSGKSSGDGAGARVAVRFVLEDHETAILELGRAGGALGGEVRRTLRPSRLWWTRWRSGCRKRRRWWRTSARSLSRTYGT